MTTIKLRRGTEDQWTSANPVLAQGEPGFDTTSGVLKVGDGTTAWTDLPGYLGDNELRASFAAIPRSGARAVGQDELVVNVRDYGATGDGKTDDTAAIKDANQAAKGGVLYFPKGSYLVSAALAAQSHTIYRGAGRTAAILTVAAGSAQTSVLDLSGHTDVIVEDLGFDGSAAGGCQAGVYGSDTHAGKDWHVRRCLLTGFAPGTTAKTGQGAVYMWTAYDVSVTDCVISNSGRGIRLDTPGGDVVVSGNRITGGSGPVAATGTMLTGISINSTVQCNGARVAVTDNVVSGADMDPSFPTGTEGHAIVVYKVANVRLIGNHCLGSGRGILCSAGSFGATIQANTVEQNWDAGIRCEPAIGSDITVGSAGQHRGVVIVGNRCLDNSVAGASGTANGTAITTSYAAGSTVVGNVVQNSGKHGIHCDSDRVVILGNVVSNSWNGGASPGQGQGAKGGIGVYAAKDCIVAFNQCFDNQATQTQDYGLSVVTGNGGGPHVVFGNSFGGNRTGELHDPQSLVRNGFFGATPAARPTALPASDPSTVDATYGAEEAAVIESLRSRLDALESRLQSVGLLG